MEPSQLKQFETYCATLYTSPDAADRSAAEAALVQLSASPEYIPQCQYVLDHSKYAYAQLVAANALKKLLIQSWNHLSQQHQLEFRNYTLSYLAQRSAARGQASASAQRRRTRRHPSRPPRVPLERRLLPTRASRRLLPAEAPRLSRLCRATSYRSWRR